MKNLLLSIFVFISSFVISQSCTHTLHMTDTYGDGWNGNRASVSVNGTTVISNVTLSGGYGPATVTFSAATGATIRVWRSVLGSWAGECQIRVTSSTGATVIALQTLQPGSATSGGSVGTAQCGGGGGSATLIPYSGSNSVSCGTNTTLYDHGGQFGSYSNYANGHTVLNNGGSAVISVSGSTSGESCCDWVRIYQGSGTGGPILGQWQMGSFVSYTSAPGSTLTVQFYSDVSVTGSGFALNVTYTGSCSPTAPPNPTSISASNATVCPSQPVTLTANGSVGTTYWFTTGCTTVGQIGTGSSITVNPNVSTTYWARNLNGGLWSSGCAQYTVSVVSPPQAPSSSSYTVNCGVSPTLTAIGGAGNYQWWTNSNATGLLFSGQTYNTGAISQNTTFWVTSSNGICNSTASSYSVNVTPPLQPAVNNTSVNCSNTATLYVTNGAFNVSWYTNSNGTGLVGSGSSYTTPQLTSNTTYYVGSGSGLCATPLTPVTVTVNPLASPTVSGNPSLCTGNSTTLTASGGSNYTWYANANATGQLGTGANYVTPSLTSNTTLYVQSSSGSATTQSVGFNSCYAINNWSVSHLNGGNGSVNSGGSPNSIVLTGPDGTGGNSYTLFQITVPLSGTISWNWTVSHNDCSYDTYGYRINGVDYPLATCSASGATSVSVTAGQTFAFYGRSHDGCCGTFTATISNFNKPCSGQACVSPVVSVPIIVNALPTSNAGPDITGSVTCGKNSINLQASAINAGENGTWQIISGPGGIPSLNTPNTLFQGLYGQSYVLQWNVTNNSTGCVGSDQMTVTFNQPNAASLSGLIGNGDLLWCGLTDTDWSTSTNWYQNMGTYYQRMSGAAQPVISSQVFTLNQATGGICIGSQNPTLSVTSNAYDVFVNPGITLNLTNDSLNISHDLNNNGTIVASTGLVNFTGNLNSSINGPGSTQLFNMRVNKSASATLTLNQPVSVTNNLNMFQGNLYTTVANLLTLGTSSVNPGTLIYNTGTIVGPFRRYFSNSTTTGNSGFFPVGTSTYNRYADINFTSAPGTNQFLTVQYKTGSPLVSGSPLYNGLPLVASGSLVQNYSIDGYWEVVPTGNNYSSQICQAPYNITLFANNLTGMNTPQICRIIKSPGLNHTTWQACGSHVSIPANANAQSFLITSNNTQNFSWFNIGTPNSQALPVELLSFDGDCQNDFIKLNWSTSTEHNSSYFEVQKSIDGLSWRTLTTLNAAGNSTQKLDYTTSDFEKVDGNNYYKLIQYDIDGQSKEWGPINVSCESTSKGYFSVFPNPNHGKFQLIINDKNLIGISQLVISDIKGSKVLEKEIEIKPGINSIIIDEFTKSTGIYFLQIINSYKLTNLIKIEIN